MYVCVIRIKSKGKAVAMQFADFLTAIYYCYIANYLCTVYYKGSSPLHKANYYLINFGHIKTFTMNNIWINFRRALPHPFIYMNNGVFICIKVLWLCITIVKH